MAPRKETLVDVERPPVPVDLRALLVDVLHDRFLAAGRDSRHVHRVAGEAHCPGAALSAGPVPAAVLSPLDAHRASMREPACGRRSGRPWDSRTLIRPPPR